MQDAFKPEIGLESREQVLNFHTSPAHSNNLNKLKAMNLSTKVPLIKVGLTPEINCVSLLDTGSSHSLISKSFFNKIKNEKCVKHVNRVNNSLVTANKSRMSVRQEVKIHIKIEGYSWDFTFWVVNQLPYDLILGYDFCKFSQLNLDLHRNEVSFSFAQTGIVNCVLDEAQIESNRLELGNANLTPEQQLKLEQLLSSYSDVITKRIGKANVKPYKLKINPEIKPFRSRPYQMNPYRLNKMKEIIDELIEQDVIEKSDSEFSSSSFLVEKKDKGKFRLVANFKQLNQFIEMDSFPNPNIDNLFQHFKDARFFTSIDLNHSFHQLELHPDSRKYSAFNTPFGLYQYKRVGQGLRIGSQALGRLMEDIFHDLKFKCVLNFIDDLIIYSKDAEGHINDVKTVLQRLREAGVTVNPKKLSLAKNGVQFLGHYIKDGKLHIDESRTHVVRNFPRPKNLRQLQRFVGMVSYYSKFIANFSRICEPLNQLKRKGVRFRFGEQQIAAFEKLKHIITSPPVLHLPNYDLEFVVSCDASGTAVGCVLEMVKDGMPVPIAFASRTLSKAERAYDNYRREFLSCLWGCERFKPYLQDKVFTLRTDCQAIFYVMNKSEKSSGQLVRWKARLSEYNCKIEHCRARFNAVADCLSRMYETDDEQSAKDKPSNQTESDQCNFLQHFPEVFHSLGGKQRDDPELKSIIERLENGENVQNYFLRNGILQYRKNPRCPPKVCVPRNLRQMLMEYFHNTPIFAHRGIKKTVAKITKEFSWPKMFDEIKHFVRSCESCQKSKPAQNQQVGLLTSNPPERCFERLHIDLFGSLTRSVSGNNYALVCVDTFSKFCWVLPLKKGNSDNILRALKEHIFSQHGFPEIIVSDNASTFTAESVRSYFFSMGIKHITTSVARPNSNMSERVNRNLKYVLKIYHSQTQSRWDSNLPYLMMAFNSAPHDSTGVSPAFAFLGRELNHPLKLKWNLDSEEGQPADQVEDRVRNIVTQLKLAHKKTKERYNRNRKPSPYIVGQKVLYKRFTPSNKAKKISNKLTEIYRGPFTIVEVLSPVNVRIVLDSDPNFSKVVHVCQLKPYYTRVDRKECDWTI